MSDPLSALLAPAIGAKGTKLKRTLPASRIFENLSQLMGLTTKRELARLFGVGPSSITDWVKRSGDRIPTRRLAEVSRTHGLRWQWLAYGESPPYEEAVVDKVRGVSLDPREREILDKVKLSPAFRGAVLNLLGLTEEQMRLIGRVAGSMNGQPPKEDAHPMPEPRGAKPAKIAAPAPEKSYIKYRSRSHLTKSL